MKTWRVAGINFDHMHMGDLLRQAHEHPSAEIVGISDETLERMQSVITNFGIAPERVFTDYRRCIEATKPDIVILCPATAKHGEWTEKVAPFGTHIIMEKPFAASLPEANRMIAAVKATGKQLAINWPLRWYPPHVTTKRLIDEGRIGDVIEVHYYDGNRGPMWHVADKVENTPEVVAREKGKSWFYRKADGGGSLLDYLGYGVTLGTWYHGGRAPIEVTSMVDEPAGLEVDEHSVTIARYASGLSKYETRWGTFTDPWTLQPQPKCGFVVVGSKGTISSYDYEKTIRVQTPDCPEGKEIPVDALEAPNRHPIEYVIDRLETGKPIEGPLSPIIARIGQQIVDTAIQSAREKRSVSLIS
ncbi:MAG: Gfo/Idh/MocA family oxidoreductase [Candidatus Hydrogenedentes bacterium]|nr:Gfo/Idh/MocA family oxidoreductase [Candidatus Hydrogenedentota bacterium]